MRDLGAGRHGIFPALPPPNTACDWGKDIGQRTEVSVVPGDGSGPEPREVGRSREMPQ